ncbi:hypothetical protein PFISCL1PPCAC_20004, partial [Pristionchus fissidentatus]
ACIIMSMDVIFRVQEQEFISDAVDFGSFLKDSVCERDRSYKRVGEFGLRKCNANSEHFGVYAGICAKSAEDIFNIIHIDKLRSTHVHYNFHVAEPTATAILPSSWHKTLGFLKKEHKKKLNPQYKSVANRLLKYDRVEMSLLTVPKFDRLTDCEGTNCMNTDRNAKMSPKLDHMELEEGVKIAPPDEIIVTCSVYYGYSRPLQYDERRLGRLMKVTDKLHLLGSSTLLDLKNSFQCPSDISFAQDMTTCPPHPAYLAKFQFPNSYFFIHDTFYVDDAVWEGVCTDLSVVVREWAKDKDFIGEMKIALMSQTRLVDVKARLGMPYLYVHQGQCEHLICFTDLRLWESRDMPQSYYPIKLQEKNFRRVCCIGCKMNTAEWAMIEGDRLPYTPAFVCHGCYEQFNFTKEGHKIGDFKAVPYCDRKAMDKDANLFIQKLINICKSMEGRNESAPKSIFVLPFNGESGLVETIDDVKPEKDELDGEEEVPHVVKERAKNGKKRSMSEKVCATSETKNESIGTVNTQVSEKKMKKDLKSRDDYNLTEL